MTNQPNNPGLGAQLPPAVALSWGLGKASTRGPKPELTIDQIVSAAIKIADKEGLAAVSMKRVAASLGFTTMSIYRYIASKDDLLLLMQDAVCDVPRLQHYSSGDWRQVMREYVQETIKIFTDHPWYVQIPISGVPITRNNLRVVDWVFHGLRNQPLNDYEKISILLLLGGFARSNGIVDNDIKHAIQAKGDDVVSGRAYGDALKQLVRSEDFPYLYPIMASGIYTDDADEEPDIINEFDFGLERILDGIELYIDSKKK